MMLVGAAIAALGGLIYVAGRAGFRGMPGDIAVESGGTRIYFPIVTCLVLSAIGSLIGMLLHWFRRS